jgi:hypothetical protein
MARPEGGPPELAEMRNVGGVGSVTGGSYPARIWGAFNTDYHDGRDVREFTEPEKTRSGKALRTREDQERARRAATTTVPTDGSVPPTDGSAPPPGDTTAPPATTAVPPATVPPADAEAPGNG